jgi:hypothetical protein
MTDGAFSCCIDAVRPVPERPSDIVMRSERTESTARWATVELSLCVPASKLTLNSMHF